MRLSSTFRSAGPVSTVSPIRQNSVKNGISGIIKIRRASPVQDLRPRIWQPFGDPRNLRRKIFKEKD